MESGCLTVIAKVASEWRSWCGLSEIKESEGRLEEKAYVSLSNVKLSIAPALQLALRESQGPACTGRASHAEATFHVRNFFSWESKLAKKRQSQPRMKAAFIPQLLCFLLTGPA